jgi:hypothetical protein
VNGPDRGAPLAAAPDVHVEPLNDAERGWIAEHLDRLHAAGVDVGDARQLGAYYDTLLTRWLAVPDSQRTDPNAEINLIGLGLGAHLVDRTGLEWAVVTDTDGANSEIALYGQPGDILIYPTNAVAQRWVAYEIGFLPDFADGTSQAIARIQAVRS